MKLICCENLSEICLKLLSSIIQTAIHPISTACKLFSSKQYFSFFPPFIASSMFITQIRMIHFHVVTKTTRMQSRCLYLNTAVNSLASWVAAAATKHAQMTTHSIAFTGGISKINCSRFSAFSLCFSQKLKVKE